MHYGSQYVNLTTIKHFIVWPTTGTMQVLDPRNILKKNDSELPKLSAIISHLNYEFCSYKYTVYRCASKVIRLQKTFYTSNIPYKLVLAILERHNIKDADPNYMVPPFQLTSLIHDIYFACEKLGHFTKLPSFNLEIAVTVLANFFWNIFDPHRKHSISLMEIKVSFLLLCKLYASDHLVTEFFYLACDMKNKCVSKLSFENLLNIFAKMCDYIGEGTSYGNHNIPLIMNQCYVKCHYSSGLNEYQFHRLWSRQNSRFLIYANLLALIKRIEDTEKLIHNNVCASCRSQQIIGIRFKCQSCKDLSLCLECFAKGLSGTKHKAGHRVYEVFSEDIFPKKFSHYIAKLCSAFFQRNIEEQRAFCNTYGNSAIDEEFETMETNLSNLTNVPRSALNFNKGELTSKEDQSYVGISSTASSASQNLQSIIDRLLEQNSKIEKQLECIQTASRADIANFLTAHQEFLIGIINEMRNFGKSTCSVLYPISSTPYRPALTGKNTAENVVDQNLSHSVNGADINRSYLDANKSDCSLSDLSLWFNQKKISVQHEFAENWIHTRDTEMINFKLLLNKVKEIVEDLFSDNKELAQATQNLENALDNIIRSEENRRLSS